MNCAYVDIPEGQIYYQTEGSGEPLLLLHQTPLSSNEYLEVIPILAKHYWVLAMDIPGYGKSDPPSKEHPLIEDYAQSVANFLKALGIRKTSVVGHHTGASIAAEVAAGYPELVDKLILSGCPHYTPEMRESRLSDPRFRPMEIKEDGSHIVKIWQEYKSRYLPLTSLETLQTIFVNYMIAGARATDGHQAVLRYDIEPRLQLIKSLTLLISGTKDVFYDRLEATNSLIPRCRTEIIEGGHAFITLEAPEVLAEVILDFLKNQGLPK